MRGNEYTVIGASGFIGSHLVAELTRRGSPPFAPTRGTDLRGANLGTVFYAAGVTGDFRQRPLEAAEAHIGHLIDVLKATAFERLVYLSSARVYRGSGPPALEGEPLTVDPTDPDDLYNATKLAGESVALSSGLPCVVARLSNVYGPDFRSPTFLPSIVRDALTRGVVRFRSAPESEKDYVSIEDAVRVLLDLQHGVARVYNVASGVNVSSTAIAERLASLTGCRTEFAPHGAPVRFRPISIDRIRAEFGFVPRSLLADLPDLVDAFARSRSQWI